MDICYVDAYNSPFRVEEFDYFSLPKGIFEFEEIKSMRNYKSFWIDSIPTKIGPIALILYSENPPTLECP